MSRPAKYEHGFVHRVYMDGCSLCFTMEGSCVYVRVCVCVNQTFIALFWDAVGVHEM